MKKYLIHTDAISGHRLEYIHHLYMGALLRPEDNFIFVLPKRFEYDSSCLDWPSSENVKILILKEGEEAPHNCGLLKKGWINSKTIGKYAKEYNVTDVIVISIMSYLPFLPLFLNSHVRFSGIVYRIYLYEWEDESLRMKFLDALKYRIMSHFKLFYRIFICNDSASAQCLNRIFKTDKYRYMPDPIASLSNYVGHNLRAELKISASNKILLHPGTMDSYKNTLGILRSILKLDDKVSANLTLILAGRVVPGIRKEFEQLYKKAEGKTQIIFMEGYLPFERLADLFVTCDYVLIPYTVKCQSSGVVGHAAYYGKPVIVSKGGVIGKMVRKWKLGITIPSSSEESIIKLINSIVDCEICSTEGNDYNRSHSVESFVNTIYGV